MSDKNEVTPVVVTIKYPSGSTLEYHLNPQTVRLGTHEEDYTFTKPLSLLANVPLTITLQGAAQKDNNGHFAWLTVPENGETDGTN